jgi:hypothetical protein
VHKGQLKDRACTSCHQGVSFQKVKFDHQTDSRYPLTGKHLKVACEKCHFVPLGAKEAVNGKPVVRYKPLEQKCNACHEDAHAGQFAAAGKPTECERCHDTVDFKKTAFRHAPPFTDFLLDGRHARAACDKCHPSTKVGARSRGGTEVEVVRYRPLERSCEACHSDFHQGAFQGFEP